MTPRGGFVMTVSEKQKNKLFFKYYNEKRSVALTILYFS